MKSVFTETRLSVNIYTRIKRMVKIHNLKIYLKELEKGQHINPMKKRRKEKER